MARFGKKAALDEQKKTTEVECVVSVSDDNVAINPTTGEPAMYYVEAQRLQDQVSPEDAVAGLADSNPYITNKKEFYFDNGVKKQKVSHQEGISAYGMEQIKNAAVNEFDTIKQVFNSVTGEYKEKVVHNYVVKLNIGFGTPAQGGAFFYVPKAVNETDRDKAYSERNMPKSGRELTQDILDKHNEITSLAKDAAKKMYSSGNNAADTASQ